MRQKAPVIGEIACQCCGERVPLSQQASGHAMYSCQWCGFKAQAMATAASDTLRSRGRLNNPAPAQSQAPAADQPTPTPKQKSTGLLLG